MVQIGDKVRIVGQNVVNTTMLVQSIHPNQILISAPNNPDVGYILVKDAQNNWRIENSPEYDIEFIPTQRTRLSILSNQYPALLSVIDNFKTEDDFLRFCGSDPDIRRFCSSTDEIYERRIARMNLIAYQTKPINMTWQQYYFSPEIKVLRQMIDHPTTVHRTFSGLVMDNYPLNLTKEMFEQDWLSVIVYATEHFNMDVPDPNTLDLLFKQGQGDVIEYINRVHPRAFKYVGNKYGSTYLQYLLENGHTDIFKRLIQTISEYDSEVDRYLLNSSVDAILHIENLRGYPFSLHEYRHTITSISQSNPEILQEFIDRGLELTNYERILILRETSSPKVIDLLIDQMSNRFTPNELLRICIERSTLTYVFRKLYMEGYKFDSDCLARQIKNMETVRFFVDDVKVPITQDVIDKAFIDGRLETIKFIDERLGRLAKPTKAAANKAFSYSQDIDVVKYLHEQFGYMPNSNNLSKQIYAPYDIMEYYISLGVKPNLELVQNALQHRDKHVFDIIHRIGYYLTPEIVSSLMIGENGPIYAQLLWALISKGVFTDPNEARAIYNGIPSGMSFPGGETGMASKRIRDAFRSVGINL